jgi:sialidase-1
MTVRLSFDEGKTWPAARLLWEGPSAYSCLTPEGCLFEAGDRHAYERIVWVRLTRAWIEGR